MVLRATIAANRSTDRRHSTRASLTLDGKVLSADGDHAEVVLHNLSATGMLMEGACAPLLGETFWIDLPEVDSVSATVIWRSERLAGCQFHTPLSRAALSAAELRSPGLIAASALETSYPPSAASFPDMLRRLRRERGFSRQELARRSGLSKPSLWAWETGRTAPRRKSLLALAAGLGVSLEEIGLAPTDAVSTFLDFGHAAEPNEMAQAVATAKTRIAALAGTEARNVRIFIEC